VRPCCKAHLGRRYTALLDANTGQDAPYFRILLIKEFRRLAPLALKLLRASALFAVANIKQFVGGWTYFESCPTCGERLCLIVLSDRLLMLTWRLQLIMCALVNKFDEVSHGRTKVLISEISAATLGQLQIARNVYIEAPVVSKTALDEALKSFHDSPSPAREHFLEAVSMAEIWFVLHEFAHFCLHDKQNPKPEILSWQTICLSAEHLVQQLCEIIPAAGRWQREFEADMLSVELLTIARSERFAKLRPNAGDACARELGTFETAAGLAAASEALFQIEKVAIESALGEGFDIQRDGTQVRHPSTSLRLHVQRAYLERLANTQNAFGFANVITEIGARINIAEENCLRKKQN
jgi:hypothetical protein